MSLSLSSEEPPLKLPSNAFSVWIPPSPRPTQVAAPVSEAAPKTNTARVLAYDSPKSVVANLPLREAPREKVFLKDRGFSVSIEPGLSAGAPVGQPQPIPALEPVVPAPLQVPVAALRPPVTPANATSTPPSTMPEPLARFPQIPSESTSLPVNAPGPLRLPGLGFSVWTSARPNVPSLVGIRASVPSSSKAASSPAMLTPTTSAAAVQKVPNLASFTDYPPQAPPPPPTAAPVPASGSGWWKAAAAGLAILLGAQFIQNNQLEDSGGVTDKKLQESKKSADALQEALTVEKSISKTATAEAAKLRTEHAALSQELQTLRDSATQTKTQLTELLAKHSETVEAMKDSTKAAGEREAALQTTLSRVQDELSKANRKVADGEASFLKKLTDMQAEKAAAIRQLTELQQKQPAQP